MAGLTRRTVNTLTGLSIICPFKMPDPALIIVAAAALITLTGCGTNPTNAQIGTATGAVVARRRHAQWCQHPVDFGDQRQAGFGNFR